MTSISDWAVRTLEHLYGSTLDLGYTFASECLAHVAPGLDVGQGCGFSLLETDTVRWRLNVFRRDGVCVDLTNDPGMKPPPGGPVAAPFQSGPITVLSSVVGKATVQGLARGVPVLSPGCEDMVGLPSMPAANLGLAVFCPIAGDAEDLLRGRRSALWRLSFHLETAVRLRLAGAGAVGRITPDGRLDLATELDADEPEALREQVKAVERVRLRANRSDADKALRLWRGLVGGRFTVFEETRGHSRAYALYENAPRCLPALALTARERGVLEELAGDLSQKEVGWVLGLSESQVSMALSQAALKLGVARSHDAVRLARLLLSPGTVDSSRLSTAEREVLLLLERGLSNLQVATVRGTSERTVANQVASILRKTGQPSRRALWGRPARNTDIPVAGFDNK